MQTDRLRLLVELRRLGSMAAVGDELGTTTSTVSQQLAALAREVGVALHEPDGRRVRLTPAGRRLSEHAVRILAAVEAARVDLDPAGEPAGTVRVAGFATAVRQSLLPVVADLAQSHPQVELRIAEHEPADAARMLASDEVDLVLTYDYDLAPATADDRFVSTPLWTAPWGLGVPVAGADLRDEDALATFARFGGTPWIVNSRNTADEQVVRVLSSMAGVVPQVTHQVDSLDLVQDLIAAGLGIGLLPLAGPTSSAVRLLPLRDPAVTLRSYAVVRRGRSRWAPLQLVLDRLTAAAG